MRNKKETPKSTSKAGYTLIVKYAKTIAKNEKCIAVYFTSLFSRFASLFSLFAFRSSSRQGWHLREKSKDFVPYFFAALKRHKIRIKYESVQPA